MIVQDVQMYLQNQKRASIEQIAIHFDMSEDALRGILRRLVRKGRIRYLGSACACHGCSSCSPGKLEIYEWGESAKSDLAAPTAGHCCN